MCICIQLGNGVKTNAASKQFVELGDLSQACFVQFDTCDSAGASMSLWIKFGTYHSQGGMVSFYPKPLA